MRLRLPLEFAPLVGAALQWSCGSNHSAYDAPTSLSDDTSFSSSGRFGAAPPCKEGLTQECVITLGEHNGILSCFHGYKVCSNGTFGSCLGESLSEMTAPTSTIKSKVGLLASSGTPDSCADNPCDPFCQKYLETPDEPLVAKSLGPGFSWETGSIDDSAVSSLAAANVPCHSGNDCQFNQRCENVATSAQSAHSKCESGEALIAGADTCVGYICETNPECCQRGWNCAHDVCDTGEKLSLSCDDDNPSGSSCVAAVCASDPSCCTNSWDGACVALAQSQCGINCGSCGPGETPSADGSSCYYLNEDRETWSVARAACQAHGSGWDLVTVNSGTENALVHSLIDGEDVWLGYTCSVSSGSCNSPFPWAWANGNSTYVPWNPGEPNDGSSNACARMRDAGGDTRWYDKPCSDEYDSICEGPPSAGDAAPEWSSACIDLVAPRCDALCSDALPLSELGQCVPWRPGATDPASPDTADLALGIPCGEGTVPICNHGGIAAPAGLTVDYYDSSSHEYPECSPDPNLIKGSCDATTEPIPPGECVSVSCPTNGPSALVEDDTLVVNAQQTVSEHSCLDNWTVYSDGVACGVPSCAGTSSQAVFKPVRMLILVDRSYSMVSGGRWTGAKAALTSFFESATSAGIGVAIDYFPIDAGPSTGDGCAGGTNTSHSFGSAACNPAPCGNPMVPLEYLSAAPSPIDTHEQRLVSSFGGNPTAFSTPSLPALTGALDWATAEQASKPDETFVVVFVTDGEPSTCLVPGTDVFGNSPITNAALATLAGNVHSTTGVRTYTLGLEGSDIDVLDNIAAAGGTSEAFVINGNNANAISTQFTDALVQISRQGVSCSFPLTAPEGSDPDRADVVYSSPPSSEVLPRLSDRSECGAGWYFDDNDNPQEVFLCPETCEIVQADSFAEVTVDVPCAPILDPAVFTEQYEATCDESQSPFWQFLHYTTSVPAEGNVEFRVRTASSPEALSSAEYQLASTGSEASPNCIPGATPGCPVDLVTLLDSNELGSSTDSHLELEITINPGSNGQTPTVDSWQVTYSCQFDE